MHVRCCAHWALYAAAGLLAVLLVSFIVHSTWRDNQQKASNQQSAHQSDMIKVLIVFLQYLVIVSSLSVPWPTGLAYFFKVAKFIFAAPNGQIGSVALDCMLPQSSVPVSVQRQLIYLVSPIGILAGVFLLFTAKALVLRAVHVVSHVPSTAQRGSNTSNADSGSGSIRQQWQQLHLRFADTMPVQMFGVMCVITFVFTYPFLVRVSLGMFACLQLDVSSNAHDPYPQFAVASASRGYWVHAMHQPCFEGWHLLWALGLGLPCVLLFCVAMPLALLVSLAVTRAALQRGEFKANSCSFYRPYVEKRCWWEGLVTIQTMLLVTVSVFRYTLGGYYSALLVTLLFTVMASLQLIFMPYAARKLHVMQLLATGCLYLNGCIAQSLFSVDKESSPVFKEVIGGVGVLLNVAFLGWCCYGILAESQGFMGRVYGAMNQACVRCWSKWCGCSSSNRRRFIGVEIMPPSDDDDGHDRGNQLSARMRSLTILPPLRNV